MNPDGTDDLSGFSMLDLFKVEVENQKTVLTTGLLALEEDPTDDRRLESLMRAAHSIKGAARIVDLPPAVSVAHKMEDVFEAVRRDSQALTRVIAGHPMLSSFPADLRKATSLRELLTDLMLVGVDLIERIAATPEEEVQRWSGSDAGEIESFTHLVDLYREIHSADAGNAPPSGPASPPLSERNLADHSMLDLFRLEVETQKAALIEKLLELEKAPADAEHLEALMRAAHSIKGAARIVNLEHAVKVAHGMEDAFEAARKNPGRVANCPVSNLSAVEALDESFRECPSFVNLLIDVMLAGVDLLSRISTATDPASDVKPSEISFYLRQLSAMLGIFNGNSAIPGTGTNEGVETEPPTKKTKKNPVAPQTDNFLRITAGNLNRVLALAGEAQIETQRLRPFANDLARLKRQLAELNQAVDDLRDSLAAEHLSDESRSRLTDVRDRVASGRRGLNNYLVELESIGRRHANVSGRLYDAAIACRMRPFRDGVQAFPRMVRDIARQLGKQVRLHIVGEDTQVDRDILERMEALITQLLRNAIDHGFEEPDERIAAGKESIGSLTLEARHSSGKLLVSVTDDGRGIHYERLRASVVNKRLTTKETASRLSDAELLEFLFLPGFSQKETVTEISGRGVGLDIVYNMVKSVRGAVRIYNTPGEGTRFELQLPLTLSVLRGLLADVNGQPYAFPLAEIQGTVKLAASEIDRSASLPTAQINGQTIEIIPVARVFDQRVRHTPGPHSIILIGERDLLYGLEVDRFLGERELVVQPLDPRLGKIQDISAGALMDDGKPVLIVDIQDLIRGTERICRGETVFLTREQIGTRTSRHRILVADDSLTVREMEKQLLVTAGYEVTVAVDGVDAWNAIRAAPKPFDLIVTDMDMPRMSGVELCELIRADTSLGNVPVIMITYKDREEDRRRAIDAGVNHFQTKAAFEDEIFLGDVSRLITARAN